MAARDYAIRPKTILKRLRRIAPDMDVEIGWFPDYSERWDGDGPDPAEEGMVAHNVEVKVTVTDQDGEEIATASDHLGGVWVHPDEPDPEIHGYFPDMLSRAIEEAAEELAEHPRPLEQRRKAWDPREAADPWESYLEQLRLASEFMKRSSKAIYRRNMEYHRRREARERARRRRSG